MPVQLGHEALTEPHDLVVGSALGIEIRAALAAADRHPGERVLEGLLEAEELDDAEVDRGMETKPALVRPERGVELDTEATVDVDLAAVVLPRHAEDDLALRLADALDDLVLGQLGMLGKDRPEGHEDIPDGLVELDFPGVAAKDIDEDALQLLVQHVSLLSVCRRARHALLFRKRWNSQSLHPEPRRTDVRSRHVRGGSVLSSANAARVTEGMLDSSRDP